MQKIIEVKKLTKKYANHVAVDNLSFTVTEGEILGLIGPNGSGKTTTINCILSLLKYDSGSIKILGEEMTPNSYKLKKEIGVVFQDIAVFDELNVYDNVNYFCGLYIKDAEIRTALVNKSLNLVGLTEYQKYYPHQLSGGLLRRLNIACGIAHEPKIIILDEPTIACDPQSRNHILEGIKSLRDNGATIIYTTHYLEEADSLCDQLIILDEGKIIANGTPSELKSLTNIAEKVEVEIPKLTDKQLTKISHLKNIATITYQNNLLNITYLTNDNNLKTLIDHLKKEKITYNKIYSERPTLNDVFLELTGKGLRD